MKNNNKKKIACVFLVLIGQPAWSYEQPTHQDLSQKALEASRIEATGLLADLGLIAEQKFPGSDQNQTTILGLIRHGADREDEGTRPKNHFYDPHHDRPATLPPWLTVGIAVGETSPDWIVDGLDQEPGEEFSVRRARELFVEALAAVTPESRNAAWGRMFQTLGHVIHHLQDMAQPQHVRNDVHYINEFLATHFDGEFKLAWEDRSWFERYTLEKPAIWGAHVPAAASPVTFDRARDFWTTRDGRGIAQFTNRNFVSSDTNFTYGSQGDIGRSEDYPSPEPVGRYHRSVRDPALGIANAEELCGRLAAHPVARGQPCEIDFVGSLVVDSYGGGAPVFNDRAASFSVFDAQLGEVDRTHFGQELFTLNSINFKAAYRFLIPQAINYSAGMINHFFRGRLQLRDAAVHDGYVTLEVANVSAPGNDFSDGRFSIHYDSISGARKPLATEAVDLAAGASRELRFVVPFDLDLRADNPFALVFDGRIGADAGVSGLVFDVPDAVEGFVFGASLPNGPAAPQLLYRSQGQWLLHPQGQLPTGGTVDWKGWYVDGKPTRMLSWDGWRYAKLSAVVRERSPRIYAGGKPMAVAPWPVLGAALQKDADGSAWIVAICEDKLLDQDVVIRRPARKSTSPALYDAATAPDGWRVTGRFPRPPHLSPVRESWQFNGAGTEAQAMRALAGSFDDGRRPHTRLKASIHGESAVFQDLGNTRATRTVVQDVTASRTVDGQTYDYCYQSGTIDATTTTTTTGSPVVAVDYVDGREVLARISVESSRVWTEHGATSFQSTWVDADQTDTSHWTLEIGADRHEVLTEDASSHHRFRLTDGYQLDTSRSVLARSAIVALDLRSGLVLLRRSHEERSAETTDPTTPNGPSAGSVSTHRQYAIAGPGDALSARVDVSTSAFSAYVNGFVSTYTGTCNRNNMVRSGRETREEPFDLSLLVGHLGYNASADVINSATDRSGNVFVSLRHTDAVTQQLHYLNYLTGADPVALLGVDPQRPLFGSIRPR